ncbi:hypothetical protein ACU4GD_22880 [Cupriavidus basilensis]
MPSAYGLSWALLLRRRRLMRVLPGRRDCQAPGRWPTCRTPRRPATCRRVFSQHAVRRLS